jgi:hypothetical protein
VPLDPLEPKVSLVPLDPTASPELPVKLDLRETPETQVTMVPLVRLDPPAPMDHQDPRELATTAHPRVCLLAIRLQPCLPRNSHLIFLEFFLGWFYSFLYFKTLDVRNNSIRFSIRWIMVGTA